MLKRNRVLAALLLLVVSFFWTAAAQARWYRAETKHFIFYSSGSLSQLEDFAIETEKFDAMLRRRFNIEEGEITNRLTIYVLPNSKQVSELKGDKSGFLGGFYQANEEGSFAVSNRERPIRQIDQSGMEILFHEYTHHFFARHLPASYPQWLNEGFAEYYSTTEFERGGGYTVGKPVNSRAYGLMSGLDLPIRDILLEGLDDSLSARQKDLFYGRSWMLVHKLMSSQEGKTQLSNYIRDFNSDKSEEDAAIDNFGDLDELDKELERSTKKGFLSYIYSLPVDFDAGFTSEELDETDGDLVELQLERRAGVTPVETRDRLRELAAANPGRADVLNELALAEWRLWGQAESKEDDEAVLAAAEKAVDAALAIDPKHVRANVLKAKLMGERLGASATAEHVKAIRRHLITANRADPLDPLPLFEYFRSFAEFGETPPEIAIDGLAQSFSQAPEVVNFRVALAFAFANEGNFDTARRLVRYLAYNPHMAAAGQSMLSQLAVMETSWQMNERRREEYEREVAKYDREMAERQGSQTEPPDED